MVCRLKAKKCQVFFSFFSIMLWCFCSTYAKQNSIKESTEPFVAFTYKETPMGLYVPNETGKKLPIVMFLHGCNNNPVYSTHWIISTLNAIEPCAVFLPTAPETQNTEYSCADWGGTYDSKIRPQMENALEALDSLIIANNFDTSRQYLYGESMGGEGVYRLLSDFPERFAGAITVGGYTLTKSAKKMAKTPLWIVVGASDEINSVDSNKAMYDSIVNAGGTSVRYTAYPNLGHVGGIEKARTDSELTKWLLAQNCTTSVFKQIKMQNDALNQSSFLKFSHGNIHISSQLPQGSVVKLFDLSGQVLFKTITRNASITFPVQSVNRTVLWNISNNNFSISGKVPVCTK